MKASNVISNETMVKLRALGIENENEILLYLPSEYVDYRNPEINVMKHIDSNEKRLFRLMLEANPVIDASKRPAQVKLKLTDGQTSLTAMCFGGAFQWREKKQGDVVLVTGKIATYQSWVQVKGIELIPTRDAGRIAPKYKGKDKVITSGEIAESVSLCLNSITDQTTSSILEKMGVSEYKIIKACGGGFSSLSDILKAAHRPDTIFDVEKSNQAIRLINAYHAILLSLNVNKREATAYAGIEYSISDIKKAISHLPFTLTQDQRRAIWEVSKDLFDPRPMDRLLSGDVGCGKTVSYSVPSVCAHKAGKNVVIIMPNTLLAKQVANEISSNFPGTDVRLILGGSGSKKHEPIVGNPIIVGTSAIIWWMKSINNTHRIDLLVVDEQQKLGVEQKNSLMQPHTNFLEATATAIPKTSALINYGGKDVTYIEECPVKKEISTVIVGKEHRQEVFDELNQIIKDGGQIAILYPTRQKDTYFYNLKLSRNFDATNVEGLLGSIGIKAKANIEYHEVIEGVDYNAIIPIKITSEQKPLLKSLIKENLSHYGKTSFRLVENHKNVENAVKEWEKLYPGRVVMIHGGLSSDEKDAALSRAKNNECDVIITSSVIEIGLTLPSLRGLLVRDADKYGASTLHQFRGRIARHGGNGAFYLYVDINTKNLDQKSKDRLGLLVKHKKGSEIAKEDMNQRGFGDLTSGSSKQAGFYDGIFTGVKMTPQDADIIIENISHREDESHLSY